MGQQCSCPPAHPWCPHSPASAALSSTHDKFPPLYKQRGCHATAKNMPLQQQWKSEMVWECPCWNSGTAGRAKACFLCLVQGGWDACMRKMNPRGFAALKGRVVFCTITSWPTWDLLIFWQKECSIGIYSLKQWENNFFCFFEGAYNQFRSRAMELWQYGQPCHSCNNKLA